MSERIAIYPGSFDPVTSGHLDIIRRSSKLFDKIIVVVMTNHKKQGLYTFSVDERVDLIRRCTKDLSNVSVDSYMGLLADYAKAKNAVAVVKGLRAGSDFEYEFQMALINRKINPDLDTMFLTSDHQFVYLSSSVVKELGHYNVDLSDFLPEQIIPDFQTRINKIRQGGNP